MKLSCDCIFRKLRSLVFGSYSKIVDLLDLGYSLGTAWEGCSSVVKMENGKHAPATNRSDDIQYWTGQQLVTANRHITARIV